MLRIQLKDLQAVEQIEKILSAKWLGGLAAILTILWTVYRFRFGIRRIARMVWELTKTSSRRFIKRLYSFLGLVTYEDFMVLQGEVKKGKGIPASSVGNGVPAQSKFPGPSMIQRVGLKFGLDDRIWRHLGKRDPVHVDDIDIDFPLQGPFCRNCLRTLVVKEIEYSEFVYYISNKCIECEQVWRKAPDRDRIIVKQLKREIYKRLDAELRKTGKIATTDESSVAVS